MYPVLHDVAELVGDVIKHSLTPNVIVSSNVCELFASHVSSNSLVLLTAYKGGILKQNYWTNQYRPILLKKTDYIAEEMYPPG